MQDLEPWACLLDSIERRERAYRGCRPRSIYTCWPRRSSSSLLEAGERLAFLAIDSTLVWNDITAISQFKELEERVSMCLSPHLHQYPQIPVSPWPQHPLSALDAPNAWRKTPAQRSSVGALPVSALVFCSPLFRRTSPIPQAFLYVSLRCVLPPGPGVRCSCRPSGSVQDLT